MTTIVLNKELGVHLRIGGWGEGGEERVEEMGGGGMMDIAMTWLTYLC